MSAISERVASIIMCPQKRFFMICNILLIVVYIYGTDERRNLLQDMELWGIVKELENVPLPAKNRKKCRYG